MHKILVLGNGFDVACGMPTKYTEFLEFVKYIYPGEYVGHGESIPVIDDRIMNVVDNPQLYGLEDLMPKVKEVVKHNAWINHFLKVEKQLPEGSKWMDFEEEMKRVIEILDMQKNKDFQSDPMSRENEKMITIYPNALSGYDWFYFFAKDDCQSEIEKLLRDYCILEPEADPRVLLNKVINVRFNRGLFERSLPDLKKKIKQRKTYDEIREGLLQDLDGLKFVLKVYLHEFAPLVKNEWDEITHPVRDCIEWFCDESDSEETEHLLLNFNYTQTFTEIVKDAGLKIPQNIQTCHIHGKTEAEGKGNIVIGIDDGSDKEDVFWGEFEKYYQKIRNGVDGSFYSFVESEEYSKGGHEVRIIGHSLALTDRHPLEKIFNMPNTKIHCYFHKDSSEVIRKATAIIGKDKILLKTLGEGAKLTFLSAD